MKLVEKHNIKYNDKYFELCHKSKNLYNYCNYILRQEYFSYRKAVKAEIEYNKQNSIKEKIATKLVLTKEYDMTKELGKTDQPDYRSLPISSSQQIVKLLYKNWKSFLKALRDFWKNPKKYKAMPKPPRYKDKEGQNIVIFTKSNCKIKNGYLYLQKKNCGLNPIQTRVKQDHMQQVRILPKTGFYTVEIVYNYENKKNYDLDENIYMGIDLGINNLLTCITSNGLQPIIINGKTIKSINRYYNKKKSKLMSYVENRGTSKRIRKLTQKRTNKIDYLIHNATTRLINYCIANKIGNVVIGYNAGWKQNVKIGKVNNQKFVGIPFLKIIRQLEYKCELAGITVKTVEENHTSKCDSLSLESIQHHDQYKGKRKKRGLFQSSTMTLLNADVNGAINILRKEIGDTFLTQNFIRAIKNPKRYPVMSF